MSDPPKKFTFGFSKVVKKSNLVTPAQVPKEKKDVQFIECVEENNIKLKEGEEQDKVDEPLVIPIIGPRKSSTITNGKSIAEIAEDFSDVGNDITKVKQEPIDVSVPSDSLEALAAREILREGSEVLAEKPESTLESLPQADSKEKEALQKESTLEDYESIPVNQFGLAMLRGMGWKAEEGIGKNSKLVPVTAPVVRPKGMGLGADKMLLAAAAAAKTSNSKDEEQLKMIKGAFVKIVAGNHKDQYGQVEGFNDDSGRVVVKMAIGGHVVSVNEATVLLVSKSDYSKNSKVLNAAKYDEFKKKEDTGEGPIEKRKKSPTQERKSRHQSPLPFKGSQKTSSSSKEYKDYSHRKEKSPTPNLKPKREKYHSRSRSRSPERSEKKNKNSKDSSSRGYRDRSQSPYKTQSRRDSPSDYLDRRKNISSLRSRRSSSGSPEKSSRYQSMSKSKRRSRSRSVSLPRDKHFRHGRARSDSDSDTRSEKKKKKKKNKEKRRARSTSSSLRSSQSRSPSPKSKSKKKKHKKSRSRSPSSRKHR